MIFSWMLDPKLDISAVTGEVHYVVCILHKIVSYVNVNFLNFMLWYMFLEIEWKVWEFFLLFLQPKSEIISKF